MRNVYPLYPLSVFRNHIALSYHAIPNTTMQWHALPVLMLTDTALVWPGALKVLSTNKGRCPKNFVDALVNFFCQKQIEKGGRDWLFFPDFVFVFVSFMTNIKVTKSTAGKLLSANPKSVENMPAAICFQFLSGITPKAQIFWYWN